MDAVLNAVLTRYGLSGAQVTPLSGGTNESYRVDAAEGTFLLQRPNDAAEPARTDDIASLTEHLARKGMATPRIVKADGMLEVEHEGRWRLCTWIPGRTVRPVHMTAEEALSMARLLAQFHGALADYSTPFHPRHRFHDIDAVAARLHSVHAERAEHPLHDRIRRLIASVDAIQNGISLASLPRRPCHGDPKVANVVFADDTVEARAFIDLGAVGAYPIAIDVGDMLRSMCSLDTFDAVRFREVLDTYRRSASFLDPDESAAIPDGTRLVMAELAARYLIDAYEECVFVGKTVEERVVRAERLIAHAQEVMP